MLTTSQNWPEALHGLLQQLSNQDPSLESLLFKNTGAAAQGCHGLVRTVPLQEPYPRLTLEGKAKCHNTENSTLSRAPMLL